jgi:hypothetical protein
MAIPEKEFEGGLEAKDREYRLEAIHLRGLKKGEAQTASVLVLVFLSLWQGCQIFLGTKTEKYTKLPQNLPNPIK